MERQPNVAARQPPCRRVRRRQVRMKGKAPHASRQITPPVRGSGQGRSPTRDRGRPARILIPRWRWWSVGATLPAGSHPAGVNRMGQSESKARPRCRSIPAAQSAYAVPGKCAGGTPAFPGGPSTTQPTGNMIYTTPRNRARRRLQASRITPPRGGVISRLSARRRPLKGKGKGITAVLLLEMDQFHSMEFAGAL